MYIGKNSKLLYSKLYEIVLKPVNEIRFIRKITDSIKHYNINRW